MALVAADWPVHLRPRRVRFRPENQSRSGGLSTLGNEQVTVAPSARWRASLTLPAVNERTILAWRAFVGAMDGRAGTVLVPNFDAFTARDGQGRRLRSYPSYGWGGDLEQDGVAFNLSGWGIDDSVVHATLAASAALNATQISVNYAEGIDGVRPGQYFGIGNRLHIVTQTWQVDDDSPTQIRFRPWLRAAVPSGTKVIIENPLCLMRFADDMTGDLDLDLGRWGTGEIEMVEAI